MILLHYHCYYVAIVLHVHKTSLYKVFELVERRQLYQPHYLIPTCLRSVYAHTAFEHVYNPLEFPGELKT